MKKKLKAKLHRKHNHHEHDLHQCLRCKRRIWVEESVKRGMGKICSEKGLGSKVSAELASELSKMVGQILKEQKTGVPAPFRSRLHDAFKKPTAVSSKAKWLLNQRKLKEGWK